MRLFSRPPLACPPPCGLGGQSHPAASSCMPPVTSGDYGSRACAAYWLACLPPRVTMISLPSTLNDMGRPADRLRPASAELWRAPVSARVHADSEHGAVGNDELKVHCPSRMSPDRRAVYEKLYKSQTWPPPSWRLAWPQRTLCDPPRAKGGASALQAGGEAVLCQIERAV